MSFDSATSHRKVCQCDSKMFSGAQRSFLDILMMVNGPAMQQVARFGLSLSSTDWGGARGRSHHGLDGPGGQIGLALQQVPRLEESL